MVDEKLDQAEINKINKKHLESLQNYRDFMSYASGDVPIQVLCLPKSIEKILIDYGLLRVYDLFDRDLTKIKGIGKTRIRYLASSLDQFLSMR